MSSQELTSRIPELPLFRGLQERETAMVAECLHWRRFPAGTNIMAAQTPGDVMYLILSGTLKIKFDQADGDEVIVAMLGPGEVVGELSVLDSAGRSADVVTQEESALAWMDRATVERLLQDVPGVARNMLRILTRRVRLSTEQIRALCALDVYGKVARQLLVFADQYGIETQTGKVIPMRLTQGDVAGLVGASRERVNQVFGNLRRRGLIDVDHDQRVTVRDPAKLRELIAQR